MDMNVNCVHDACAYAYTCHTKKQTSRRIHITNHITGNICDLAHYKN